MQRIYICIWSIHNNKKRTSSICCCWQSTLYNENICWCWTMDAHICQSQRVTCAMCMQWHNKFGLRVKKKIILCHAVCTLGKTLFPKKTLQLYEWSHLTIRSNQNLFMNRVKYLCVYHENSMCLFSRISSWKSFDSNSNENRNVWSRWSSERRV